MKLWSRIFGTEQELESADRRAFIRGMTVTAAGLVVPAATVFGPRVVPAPFESPYGWDLSKDILRRYSEKDVVATAVAWERLRRSHNPIVIAAS